MSATRPRTSRDPTPPRVLPGTYGPSTIAAYLRTPGQQLHVEVPSFEQGEFAPWYKVHRARLGAMLTEHGSLYLSGVEIGDAQRFASFMQIVADRPFSLVDNNSTRSRVAEGVYTASEYDAEQPIFLHTEYSYSRHWPSRLGFSCIEPASEAGATTLGDAIEVLARLPTELVDAFERRGGIRYVRNMHGGHGLGPSWQEAFATTDRAAIATICHELDSELSWNEDGSLRVVQRRPALRQHPQTGARVWFNQVDQYCLYTYGEDFFETLLELCEGDPERLPMHATFADGAAIEPELIATLREVLDSVEHRRPWAAGDVLLVDNMRTLHGRERYRGPREVLVYAVA